MHYLGAMSTDIAAGLSTIEGHADTALGVAVGIGVVVIGWGYIRSLVKRGK